MENVEKINDPKQCCSARNVLWYLVFAGFAVNYMIYINLNIAMVSMVKPEIKYNVSTECTSDLEKAATGTVNLLRKVVSKDGYDGRVPNRQDTDNLDINDSIKQSQGFDWDEKQQSDVLASFFWLHWLTQLPGGILARKCGGKLVFGGSNFIAALCCFFIPICAHKGAGLLKFTRIFQGLVAGLSWPAMHSMTARWIPPNERSKFVTAYLGICAGAAFTYLVSGFIIDNWGWEVVFYVSGVLGCLWFLAWGAFAHDNPKKHPKISEEERRYIIASLGSSVAEGKEKLSVPWTKILGSTTVLMHIIAQCGAIYAFFILTTQVPTYLKFIHGKDIAETRLLSSLPHFLSMIFALIFSQYADYLLRSNEISRTNLRKLATGVCCIVQGLSITALTFTPCNYTATIAFLTLAMMSHGAISTGPLASIVDISPNFASIILGLCGTIVGIIGFVTPIVVEQFTFHDHTILQWQKVFWLAAGILVTTGILYVIFAESEIQSWNSPSKQTKQPETELMAVESKDQEEATDNENVPQ